MDFWEIAKRKFPEFQKSAATFDNAVKHYWKPCENPLACVPLLLNTVLDAFHGVEMDVDGGLS
jgi:hypothetical protein